MNITFENPDKINGLMTIVVEEADYNDKVTKQLKDYRKRANVPGFRPGQAPMGMIKRQFGTAVKVDEINKLLGESLQKYIQDNKIEMLGQPLADEDAEPVDLEKPAPYTFKFKIAVAPEFDVKLTGRDKVPYYDITVDDKLIDQQVDMFASRAGHYDKADQYDAEQRDMLKGDLRELDENGNTLEGGVTVEGAMLMPQYFKDEDQKKLFEGAKPGDIITWNPAKAYEDNETQLASLLKVEKDDAKNHKGNFSFQVTEVQRFVKAEVNADLWEGIYGKESGIKDEKGFREAIAKGLKDQLVGDSDYKFLQDLRQHVEKKVGKLTFPEELLKRIMKENNKDKGDEFVEKNFNDSLKELAWHLAKEKLAEAQNIKVDDKDVQNTAKMMARAQFAQYGMDNVPEEYVDKYAQDMLKKREYVDSVVESALDKKLTDAYKDIVKLDHKEISVDDFNKMMQE
ncbi:MAG: trigger factor [Prevotella sp.]|nr:trigger factor [Prevotella sp.]